MIKDALVTLARSCPNMIRICLCIIESRTLLGPLFNTARNCGDFLFLNCPFGDEALLANAAKLETMRSLWMSNCSVNFEAFKLLAQKLPGLNVEITDKRQHPDTRPESCPVEKLYIYRTVSGRRFDTPGFVWIIDEDATLTPFSNGNCSLASA
ncbi:unnamed protein product [Withania somnifera]